MTSLDRAACPHPHPPTRASPCIRQSRAATRSPFFQKQWASAFQPCTSEGSSLTFVEDMEGEMDKRWRLEWGFRETQQSIRRNPHRLGQRGLGLRVEPLHGVQRPPPQQGHARALPGIGALPKGVQRRQDLVGRLAQHGLGLGVGECGRVWMESVDEQGDIKEGRATLRGRQLTCFSPLSAEK